ncbi:hypothetical protein STEG23_011896 [Scotinomys teguina]
MAKYNSFKPVNPKACDDGDVGATDEWDQPLCDPGDFLCHDHVTCVSQSWLCDGDPDCPDESDESSITCK